jgi:hypothetical protein
MIVLSLSGDSEGKRHSQGLIHSSLNQLRRICPGRHFAELALWAAMVSILSTVHITKSKDSEGVDIPVIPEYTGGLTRLAARCRYLTQD